MDALDELMTSEEVTALLKVHKNWLAEARCDRRANQPPYIRIGGTLLRYKRSAVLSWVESQERQAVAA